MDEALNEQRVYCRQCRFRFAVTVSSSENWRVEAQCLSCEAWASFTAADTQGLPLPDPAEREVEVQQIGKLLWQPINEHHGHPSLAWMDGVGNGMFEDDYSDNRCWPVPHWIYRFIRGQSTAYIWQGENSWFVRGWHQLRDRRRPPEPVGVFSFVAALDWLST
jgi:hypothetical protein